jgi:hypothetical protein
MTEVFPDERTAGVVVASEADLDLVEIGDGLLALPEAAEAEFRPPARPVPGDRSGKTLGQ